MTKEQHQFGEGDAELTPREVKLPVTNKQPEQQQPKQEIEWTKLHDGGLVRAPEKVERRWGDPGSSEISTVEAGDGALDARPRRTRLNSEPRGR